MIYLSNLSPLMQRTVAQGITFMISQSGLPNKYNLRFAKYTKAKGNHVVRLIYHQIQLTIYQYADLGHPYMEFADINDVLDYVVTELDGEQGG